MIKKCDHPGCGKAGSCRAPKNRELKDYWFFCREHAAEYNKNWNYYADMTPQEIEEDWERQTFGSALGDKEKSNRDAADYANFINDFLTGRATFDRARPAKKSGMPTRVTDALKTMNLPITASWRDVGVRYRALAKKYHPDTATDKTDAAARFAQISAAYTILREHFGK